MTEPVDPTPSPSVPTPLSEADRAALLSQAVAGEVARGGRVESHAPLQAIIVFGKPVNHTLHLILTIVTCFGWGLVWLVLALAAGEKRAILQVDAYGNILRQNAK